MVLMTMTMMSVLLNKPPCWIAFCVHILVSTTPLGSLDLPTPNIPLDLLSISTYLYTSLLAEQPQHDEKIVLSLPPH